MADQGQQDGQVRVKCRYCGKTPLVLSDATVRRHRRADGRRDCAGSGQFREQVEMTSCEDLCMDECIGACGV